LNEGDEQHARSGIHFLWPDTSHPDFKAALEDARKGIRFNNISTVFEYWSANGVRVLWLGDLETAYMESIEDQIKLSKMHIVFAPHHGRQSGKIPNSWLDKLNPNIIVIGEAPSRHLHYYSGYNTITQNRAGDITFDCSEAQKVHVYSSNSDYELEYLSQEGKWSLLDSYLGALNF
jgi:beta-lactamase superfamily II metal-dependent hydrolase